MTQSRTVMPETFGPFRMALIAMQSSEQRKKQSSMRTFRLQTGSMPSPDGTKLNTFTLR